MGYTGSTCSVHPALVRRKCDRWLVCICTSYPSTVAASFSAITQGLTLVQFPAQPEHLMWDELGDDETPQKVLTLSRKVDE